MTSDCVHARLSVFIQGPRRREPEGAARRSGLDEILTNRCPNPVDPAPAAGEAAWGDPAGKPLEQRGARHGCWSGSRRHGSVGLGGEFFSYLVFFGPPFINYHDDIYSNRSNAHYAQQHQRALICVSCHLPSLFSSTCMHACNAVLCRLPPHSLSQRYGCAKCTVSVCCCVRSTWQHRRPTRAVIIWPKASTYDRLLQAGRRDQNRGPLAFQATAACCSQPRGHQPNPSRRR